MKDQKLLTAAALVAALLAFGCRDSGEKVSDGAAGSAGTETVGTASPTAAQPSTDTAITGGTSSVLSNDDREFAMKAAMGGMAEVAMAQVALQKASNADVKAFADRMNTDHSKGNSELTQLAQNKGLAMPAETDAEHKQGLEHLSSLSSTEFDKAYIQHMVADHEKTVADFQKASQSAQDPDLKSWAAQKLPTLQDHLKQAQTINGKL